MQQTAAAVCFVIEVTRRIVEEQRLNTLPLLERQQRLAEIVTPNKSVQLVQSHSDGEALFHAIRPQHMEGIVAKNIHSTYSIDGKDNRWIKIKNYGDVVAVIGGFTLRNGVVNSVLSGLFQQGRLYFIGKVGTGKMTKTEWRELTETLNRIELSDCPFANKHPDMRGAHWVRPLLTVKIQFTEWRVQGGRSLRQSNIQSFVNVPPKDCILEGI